MTTVIAIMAATPVLAQTKAPSLAPAPARSEADCQANWKSADKNSDGRLDEAEIASAKSLIPTSITATATLAEQDFLTACKATVQNQKK